MVGFFIYKATNFKALQFLFGKAFYEKTVFYFRTDFECNY